MFSKAFVIKRKADNNTTENRSLKNIIVIGENVLFATLNHIKEMAQKTMANNNAMYVLTLLFNVYSLILKIIFEVANLILLNRIQ